MLATALKVYKGKDVIVYALPRGGVVLGLEVAKHLGAPLDLLVPRKIGHPYNSEYAIAAVAENGSMVKNEEETAHVNLEWFSQVVVEELLEAKRRRKLYLQGQQSLKPTGKISIVVDDGLATGLTMKAAILGLRQQAPKLIIVAVPVAPAETAKELNKYADEVITLHLPAGYFGGVGSYYKDFKQVSDDEVTALMKQASKRTNSKNGLGNPVSPNNDKIKGDRVTFFSNKK